MKSYLQIEKIKCLKNCVKFKNKWRFEAKNDPWPLIEATELDSTLIVSFNFRDTGIPHAHLTR